MSLMNLDDFLHRLQYEPDKVKPLDWETDWDDAPLPYKLYRGLPMFPLSREVPATLEGRDTPGVPSLHDIGHFLYYVYGLTQLTQSVMEREPSKETGGVLQICRRFVASGGGLYPSELYLYLKLGELPAGIYHYDAAHHRLALLREGNFDDFLARSLGHRCDANGCFGAAFVSIAYWKNFYKYNNFAYRLQGLDAGVLIGQLLEVAKRFGFSSSVHFQFLDQAINHLLGLLQQEESVYAVIPLSTEPAIRWVESGSEEEDMVSASDLCRELSPISHDHYVRSRRIADYPLLLQMSEASRLDSARLFRQIRQDEQAIPDPALTLPLPPVDRLSYDFAAACRNRFSPETEFVLKPIGLSRLAALLREATASFTYRNDLDGLQERPEPRVCLYGFFYGVEDVPDGAYRYDGATHSLQPVCLGDHRQRMQESMSFPNINLSQVPLSLHVAGKRGFSQSQLGKRGYRIQQMEAGMLVHRLLLAASALGMGGRPLLAFDANSSDALYRTASRDETGLIFIPVGPYRQRLRLAGSLSR
ncbi:SagB family peptide dehydrogenase [Paenibacillus thiaminolyticus]|uniref:SagB/ThcOx family dehydrogenase n=1 Tax=Paenibacillus thiaminolyticus TaxID=49283 RepID=A0A3A3GEU1_PANTH|nr:SagB family peptide dehydrogenase [Paenibacillus thiaminolyticus]RJG22492.1 SagB/ThcOx family dehydrogenase [Paenibacillus thiaminolyticus]